MTEQKAAYYKPGLCKKCNSKMIMSTLNEERNITIELKKVGGKIEIIEHFWSPSLGKTYCIKCRNKLIKTIKKIIKDFEKH